MSMDPDAASTICSIICAAMRILCLSCPRWRSSMRHWLAPENRQPPWGILDGCGGRFLESDAFRVDMVGLDAYDRNFPQKDKKTGLPSQRRFEQLAGSGRPRA